MEVFEIKKIRGKILLVDDQLYEKELLEAALKRLKWEVDLKYFTNVDDAIHFLKNTNDKVFLVISDINMPKKTGLDFKKEIDGDEILRKKAIPFIFASTAATKDEITKAYDYSVQGYFCKPMSIDEQAEMLDVIIRYWIISKHPSSF